jgi:hypothetical protein
MPGMPVIQAMTFLPGIEYSSFKPLPYFARVANPRPIQLIVLLKIF